MTVNIRFYDRDGRVRSLDRMLSLSLGGRLTVLQSPEHEAHEGHAFTFSTVDQTLANGETISVAFKTCSSTSAIHLYASFSTLVGGSLEILEDATWDNNSGTATAIINRKRTLPLIGSELEENKTATPAFTVTNKLLVGVTTPAGTAIWTRYAWGERGKVEANDYRAENELLLRCGAQYIVLFTAIGAANKGQVILNWLEHGAY